MPAERSARAGRGRPMGNASGRFGKSSTRKKESKKEISVSPGRAIKSKGKKMIIPAETVMRKMGHIESSKVTPKVDSKTSTLVGNRGTVADALAVEQAAKGRKTLPLTPLALAIRNAYKGAKSGEQERAILARIEAVQPSPSTQEIGRALVASGIPDHRASRVAVEWESLAGLPANDRRAVTLCRQFMVDTKDPAPEKGAGKWSWEDLGGRISNWGEREIASYLATFFRIGEERHRYAIILRIMRGISPLPTPEKAERLFADAPERERLILVGYYRHAFAMRDKGRSEASRREFAGEIIGLMERNPPSELLRAADYLAAQQASLGLPATPQPGPRFPSEAPPEPTPPERESEAPKTIPFGIALKAIVDSGYAVCMDGGNKLSLRGLPLWKKLGVQITPEEITELRSQTDVVIGLVDGLTNLLRERDPEDRETRKLSALRKQVDSLISLLDPVLTGRGRPE